jgi:hypothetical protein
MATDAVRAADDQPDDRSFTEKFVDGFKSTIRGTNMESRGIDYRERSPLVVPPKLDLPPPSASLDEAKIANWPKDPDEKKRKAIIAEKKKNAPPAARVQASGDVGGGPRPINIAPPVEETVIAAPNAARPTYGNDRNGTARVDPVYDQAGDLFKGGMKTITSSSLGDTLGLNSLFGTKSDAVEFAPGTEPSRQALTQPPAGYQTPSPNYPLQEEKKGLFGGDANPDRNPLASRSSASSMVTQ